MVQGENYLDTKPQFSFQKLHPKILDVIFFLLTDFNIF